MVMRDVSIVDTSSSGKGSPFMFCDGIGRRRKYNRVMTITIDKDVFAEKLSIASRFTSNKISAASSLQGVLLKGEEGRLTFFATNLTTFYASSLAVENTETFQIVLEPKKILEFLAFLPSGSLSVELTMRQVTLKMNKTKGNFPVIVASDFPYPPEIAKNAMTLETSLLTKQLPMVLFSASADDTRPVLTGINFHTVDEEMWLVATDGFRLSILKDKKLGDFPSMIVPADFLQEVVRHMKDTKEATFSYSPEEKMVSFSFGDQSFYSRLIEGSFPPFERVIPPETKTRVVLDKAEFLRSVKLISVFARDFSNVVVCEFSETGLTLRPKKEGNADNTAFMETEHTGDPQTIAFNFRFVLDLLNHIDGKDVVIEMLRPDAPAIFKTEEHSAFMHIIMPVRIQE
jgi:DNA polymerase-3 subunit beta